MILISRVSHHQAGASMRSSLAPKGPPLRALCPLIRVSGPLPSSSPQCCRISSVMLPVSSLLTACSTLPTTRWFTMFRLYSLSVRTIPVCGWSSCLPLPDLFQHGSIHTFHALPPISSAMSLSLEALSYVTWHRSLRQLSFLMSTECTWTRMLHYNFFSLFWVALIRCSLQLRLCRLRILQHHFLQFSTFSQSKCCLHGSISLQRPQVSPDFRRTLLLQQRHSILQILPWSSVVSLQH